MSDLVALGFKVDTSQLTRGQRELEKTAAAGGKLDGQVRSTSNAFNALGAAISALGLAAYTKQVIGYADAWLNVNSQIRQVTKSEEELLSVQQSVLSVAKSTRTNLESTAALYSGLARSSEELGLSQEKLVGITSTMNKLFLISGTSAQTAAGAIFQLNQGLASGALRGDEFNSVAEGAPRVLDALSQSLGIAKGDLRDFAATGGITAEVLIKALDDYAATADRLSKNVSATFAQNMQVANANITEFVGNSETLMSATSALGNSFVYLSENIDAIADAALAASIVVGARFTPAIIASGVAMANTAKSATALGAAWRFLTGPIGLAVTAIGVATVAFNDSTDKIDQSTKALKANADEAARVAQMYDAMSNQKLVEHYASLQSEVSQLMGVEKQLEAEREKARAKAFSRRGLDEEALSTFNKLTAAIADNKAGQAALTSEMIKVDEQLTKNIFKNKEFEGSNKLVIESNEDLLKSFEEASEVPNWVSDWTKAYESLLDELDPVGAATRDYQKAQKMLNDAFSSGLLSADKFAELMSKLDKRYKEQMNSILGLTEETDKWAKLTQESLDRIDQSFADVWYNILDGADDVFGSLINSFKRMLAEMAHAAITKPIMLNIQQSILGSAGGIGGLASGAGMLAGLGGSVVGLGSMVGGAGLGAFGSGLGASLGFLGTGQIGAMGSLTAGMAGAGSIMGTIGAALPIIAGISAAAMAINKVSGGGLFGTKFKETERAILLNFGDGGVSGFTESTEKRKRSLFRGTKTRTSQDAIDTSEINAAFDAIEQAIISGSQILGVTGAEAALGNFSAALKADIKDKSEAEVQEIVSAWISSTTNGMVDAALGGLLGEMQREGEPLVDTLQRVVVQTEVFNSVIDSLMLNFDGTAQAAAMAADNLVNLVGGLDQFATLNNQLMSFAGFQDQWVSALNSIVPTFNELGLVVPETREAFYDLMQGIDLSTESGQQLYATLLQLVPNLEKWYSLEDEKDRKVAQKIEEANRLKEKQLQLEQRLNDQRQNLTIKLLEAQGKSEEALALAREMELAALDPTLRAIMQQIYAEQDRATALEEAKRKQEEVTEAQKAALDELYNTLVSNVAFAESELEKARSAELDRLQLVVDKAEEAYMLEVDAINVQREAYYKLIDDLTAKADSAAVMLDKARNVELIGINAQRQAFEQLTQQLQNNSSVAQSALEKSLNAELAKYDTLAQAAQDSASAEIAAINNAANARLSALNAERSIVASVANQLGAAARGVTFKQALDAARRGDFEAASRITSGADYSDATSAKIGAAREAFALAEIGRLADAQLSDIDRQIAAQESFTASQVAAIESGTAAQLAQIEADKKAVEDQIKALLGIDDSVLSLDVAMAQYQKAQDELNAQIGSDTLDKLQAQEDALNAQIDGLLGIDNSVLGLADAIAQYNAAQSELNTALNADTLAQLQAQEDAAKALLDETIKQTQEQVDLLNKQIDELLNIDNSVMALNDAITLLLNERKALADLEYDKQVEQLNAQVEQIAAQQETTLAVYNVVAALEDMPMRIGNAMADVREPIYQTPPIVIFPPAAESATANEIAKLREELRNDNRQTAANTKQMADDLRQMKYTNQGVLP